MTIKDIESIMMIAEEQNITRAAQRLFVSQPSLSQTLKKVETELGAVLFTRTTNGLQLTYIGENFMKYAAQITNSYKNLTRFIADANNLETGRLSIGVPSYLTGSFLTEVLPRYSSLYPNIEVRVEQHSDMELEQLLISGKVDMVLGLSDVFTSRIAYEPIMNCRMLLSVPNGHPICRQGTLLPGDAYPTIHPGCLEGETLLEYDITNPMYQMIHTILDHHHISVHSRNLSGYGVEMVRRCSRAGMGFAIIPECVLSTKFVSPDEVYFYLEDNLDTTYRLCAAWPEDGDLPLAARTLIQMGREFFEKKP